MTVAEPASVIARERESALVRAAFRARRHVLLEGPTGVGKSMLVRELCRTTGQQVITVNATTTMTGQQLLGSHDPGSVLRHGYTDASFREGPLVQALRTGAILYLELANRLTTDAHNVLLTAMSDAVVSVPRYGTVRARDGFLVVAAANHDDATGTTELPAAFLDRVVRIRLGHLDAAAEHTVVARSAGERLAGPAIEQACVADVVTRRAVAAARATRRHPDLARGSSVRGALDLVAVSARLAELDGRLGRAATETDQRFAAALALSSRVTLSPDTDRDVESVIDEIWTDVLLAEHRATAGSAGEGGAAWSGSSLTQPSAADADADTVPRPDATAPNGDATADQATAPPGAMSASAGGGGDQSGSNDAAPAESEILSELAAETSAAVVDYIATTGSTAERAASRAAARTSLAQATRMASRIVLRKVRGVRIEDAVLGRPAPVRYNYGSDDLDLDRTVAELIANPVPMPSDIWVRDRVPRRRGIVLMLDISGSMRGEQLVRAATATAAAAVALHEHDELAVIAFAHEPVLISSAQDRSSPNRLVEAVLSLRPHGKTDIGAALELGLAQLNAMRSPARLGLMLTDGVHNCGTDPHRIAGRYSRLNVLASTTAAWRLKRCRALAVAGHGWSEPATAIDTLPATLSALLE